LHNESLHNTFTAQNILWLSNHRELLLKDYVARMGELSNINLSQPAGKSLWNSEVYMDNKFQIT